VEVSLARKFIALGQTPFRKGKKPAPLGDRSDRIGKDSLEKIYQTVEVINRGRAVVPKWRGLNVVRVKIGVGIHL
jgi:hypothetical protein